MHLKNEILSISEIKGTDVRDLEDNDLGEIEDVKIDLASGSIVYAVLSFGGFLGLGEKLFPIPWQALKRDEGSLCFFLDVPKEVLEEAPGYDEDDLPKMCDHTFINGVHTHYGYEPIYSGM
jgi:sporulation protein YlmC with PRC-barrel domain